MIYTPLNALVFCEIFCGESVFMLFFLLRYAICWVFISCWVQWEPSEIGGFIVGNLTAPCIPGVGSWFPPHWMHCGSQVRRLSSLNVIGSCKIILSVTYPGKLHRLKTTWWTWHLYYLALRAFVRLFVVKFCVCQVWALGSLGSLKIWYLLELHILLSSVNTLWNRWIYCRQLASTMYTGRWQLIPNSLNALW